MLVVTHPNPSSYPTSNARTLRIIVESKPDRCERLPFDRKDVQGIDTPFAFLDATSSSPKREDALFSPLYSMEDLWQRCKHHEGINYVKDCEFWDAESARFHKQFKTSSLIDFLKNRSHREGQSNGINKLARRSKLVKQFRAKYGKKALKEVLYECKELGIKTKDKVEARQKIYGALYDQHVLDGVAKERLAEWKTHLQEVRGAFTVIIKDVDGPRDDNGGPWWSNYDAKVHAEKCADLKFSFGHGYFVARRIAQIAEEVGFEVMPA